MAWTTPSTVVADQLMTAAMWNEQIRDNDTVLRAGGIAIASQATGDLVTALDSTTWTRVAASNGVPYFGGASWSFVATLSVAYPIGTIYVAVVSTNPNTLLGFGTWTAMATGRVLVGIDATQAEFDTVEETGGAKTVTLSTSELPVHSHGVTDAGHAHQIGNSEVEGEGGHPVKPNPRDYPGTDGNEQTSTATTGITLQNAGSGGAHNNLPPYQVCYIWKRTA